MSDGLGGEEAVAVLVELRQAARKGTLAAAGGEVCSRGLGAMNCGIHAETKAESLGGLYNSMGCPAGGQGGLHGQCSSI